MELNYDKFNSLFNNAKTPVEPIENKAEYKEATTKTIRSERKTEALQSQTYSTLEIYKAYQENISKSEQLQTEIIKGVKAGADIYGLFLKAVEAISCMTSTPVFYNQIKADIKNIYGLGLQEQAPLIMEIEETKGRLQRLEKAEQREPDNENIKRAVKAHKNRILELEKLTIQAGDKPA